MTEPQTAALEFDDIQGPVLLPRPLPYFGAYFIVRIDDPAQGRQMLGRLAPKVTSAADLAQRRRYRLDQRGAHVPGAQGPRRATGLPG